MSVVLSLDVRDIGNWERGRDVHIAKDPRSVVGDVGSPSISQVDTCPMALFTKSFTGKKEGLSSPNSIPLHTCVNTREIWARFFLDSTLMVEETMSKVSGVLGEMVHSNHERSRYRLT